MVKETTNNSARRQRNSADHQQLESIYEEIVQNMMEGVTIQDIEGYFTFVNPATAEMLGYSPEELIGKHARFIVPPDQHHIIEAADERREYGESDRYEIELLHRDGKRISALVSGSPRFKDGRLIGTLAVFTDITEQKRAETERERLLGAEREQRLLAETLTEISLTLTSQTSHEAVLDEILRQAQRLVPYSAGSIMLLDGNTLRTARCHGYERFGCKGFIKDLSRSLPDFPFDYEVVRSRRPQVIHNTHQDARWRVFEETAWIKSHISVPICQQERVLGLLSLDSDTPERFSDSDIHLLYPLTNAAAIALENARLLAAEAHRRREADILREVAGALTTTLDRDEVMDLILDQLSRVVDYDSAAVMLLQNSDVEIAVQRGFRSEVQQLSPKQIENFSHVQQVLKQRTAVIIADTFEDERWWHHPNADYIRCWLGVPLIAQNRVIGLLNLDKEEPGFYTEHDAKLATAFANQAAIALENTRLFAEARQRFKAMTALYEISLDIAASLDMTELLDSIIERAVSLLKADAGGIYLYDEERDELEAVTGYGYSKKYVGTRLKPGEGIAGKVLQTGEALVVDDYRNLEGKSPLFEGEKFLKAILEVPMKWRDQIIGVLVINSNQKFNEDDVWLTALFANQVAIAIQNARLFEALEARMKELQRTQTQLIQSAKMAAIGQLAASVAHELNNPLTSILGFAELLLERAADDGPSNKVLETIIRETNRASDIVHRLLDFSRKTEHEREYSNINQVIRDTLALIYQQIKYSQIIIQENYANDLPLVPLDVNQMKQVFLNIITNAIHAMSRGGKLSIATEEHEDKIAIHISDTGKGIPAAHLKRIFEPFFTTKPAGQGTGLGLSISQGIVRQHKGRIEVESREGEGTTFTIWLPKK